MLCSYLVKTPDHCRPNAFHLKQSLFSVFCECHYFRALKCGALKYRTLKFFLWAYNANRNASISARWLWTANSTRAHH